MAKLSRLQRVRRKKETKQAYLYFAIAAGLILILITWGIPAIAKMAGLFVDTEDLPFIEGENELRPARPILLGVPDATPSGSINVEGYADEGVEVLLYLNNSVSEKTIVDDSGTFNFRKVALSQGKNIIYVKALSSSGSESEISKIYEVLVDSSAPEITITAPEEGTTFRGDEERTVKVQGQVSDDTDSLTVGGRVGIISSDGTFSVRYQLDEGDQDITIVAIDEAGNRSETTLSLRYEN